MQVLPLFTDQIYKDKPSKRRHDINLVHRWYTLVLSFPPELVYMCLKQLAADEKDLVLDPFCGAGTTLVESRLLGLTSIGVDAHPFACFASKVKTNWEVDPDLLWKNSSEIAQIAEETSKQLLLQGIYKKFPKEQTNLLPKKAISRLPLHKVLVLLESIKSYGHQECLNHQLLALAKTAIQASNLRFGPEVGLGEIKQDAPVELWWLENIKIMVQDLTLLQNSNCRSSRVFLGDARKINEILPPHSVDIVITSPPYPNEKDYTRLMRLESVLLEFLRSKKDLREIKKRMIRSNTRGIYVSDDDDKWLTDYEIFSLAETIEKERKRLGKTSGFEKLYHRVITLYFGGITRHFIALKQILRPGARLAYVVGDQASFFRILIKTGELLARVAESIGYKVEDITVFRTRFATATRCNLREEIVFLKWPGD